MIGACIAAPCHIRTVCGVTGMTPTATRECDAMDERDWLAQRFDAERPRLVAVAYRMLGSLAEAEDAVQETWVRLSRADASAVDNLGGWLTTVVGRVCLNMLRSRATRRETSLDTPTTESIATQRRARRSRAGGAARRLGRPRAARRPRSARARRTPRVRAARHVRRPVRGDRRRGRSVASRGPPTREPRPTPSAGHAHGSRPPILRVSARSSTRFSPPRAAGTSMRWSRFSTPTSCSAPTQPPWRGAP